MSYFRCDLNKKLELIEINQNTGYPTKVSTGQDFPYEYTVNMNYRDTIDVRQYIADNNLNINFAKLTADNFVFKPITPIYYEINDDMATYGSGGAPHSGWPSGLYPEVKEYNASTGILSYRCACNIVKNTHWGANAVWGNNPWDIVYEEEEGMDTWYYYTNDLICSVGHICIVT